MASPLFLCIFIFSVFISSVSQILLKKSADKEYSSLKSEYLNPLVIGAYLLFFGATLVTVFAYRSVPLSFGPLLESLGYIFVGVLSYFILKEKLSFQSLCGMALIIVGIIIYSL